jgi:hypothetical protein
VIKHSNFLTAWESTPIAEQILVNLKLRLLKEEIRVKNRVATEISSDATAFFTQRSSGSSFSSHRGSGVSGSSQSGSSGGLPNRGRGYHPTGRGYYAPPQRQPPRSTIPSHLLGEHSYPHSAPPLVRNMRPELIELKKCTCCNCCGCYGHWWQECPKLFTPKKRYFLQSKQRQAQGEPTRVYHVDSGGLSSQHPTNPMSVHNDHADHLQESLDQEFFEDSLEHLQPEEHYDQLNYEQPDDSESFSMPSDYISRAYMAVSSLAPIHLTDVWIADSGANRHMTHNANWFTNYKPLRSDQR